MAREPRRNRAIYASQVRVIGEDGQQIGILPVQQAIIMAQERGLDLIEISPTAKPPVCKIADYGKFKYERKKEEHKARRKQVIIKLHEIKFGIMTDDHDLHHKQRKIEEFLTEGDKVKLTVIFRGREIEHKDLGKNVLDKMLEKLKDIAAVELPPKVEGRVIFTVIVPKGKVSNA